jgi:hypothetical protein
MNCKNCNTNLPDDSGYCISCGGKVIRNKLTLRNLFEHFSEQFLNYDNKFLKTFLHLFSKPELVIDGYINGTRKRYVNVISYFAIAITLSGLQMFILNKFFPELMDFSSMAVKGQEEFMSGFMDTMFEYNSFLMMLFIPIYALMSKIVFFNNKKYNYVEHIVIFMYTTAQTTILSTFIVLIFAILNLGLTLISILILPIIILYSAYCLKRLYKLDFSEIILKTFLFIPILIIFYLAFIILGMIIYYAFSPETFQQMIDARKELPQN